MNKIESLKKTLALDYGLFVDSLEFSHLPYTVDFKMKKPTNPKKLLNALKAIPTINIGQHKLCFIEDWWEPSHKSGQCTHEDQWIKFIDLSDPFLADFGQR